jgi:hypothetical protein
MTEQRSVTTQRHDVRLAVGERFELSIQGIEKSNIPGQPAESWPALPRWLNCTPHLLSAEGSPGLRWQGEALAAGDALLFADVDSERLETREVEETESLWTGSDNFEQWGRYGRQKRGATATRVRPVEVRVPVTLRLEFRIKIIDPSDARRADFLEGTVRRL